MRRFGPIKDRDVCRRVSGACASGPTWARVSVTTFCGRVAACPLLNFYRRVSFVRKIVSLQADYAKTLGKNVTIGSRGGGLRHAQQNTIKKTKHTPVSDD